MFAPDRVTKIMRPRTRLVAARVLSAFQIGGDFGELGEGGLQVFYDFRGDDVWIGKLA